MNTEQLKTDRAKEILNHHYVHDKGFSDDGTKGWVINAMIDTITKETTFDIIKYAGDFVGIGSFRPTNNGMFGRFDVKYFDVI